MLTHFFQNNHNYNFYTSKNNVLNNLDIKIDLFKILDQEFFSISKLFKILKLQNLILINLNIFHLI